MNRTAPREEHRALSLGLAVTMHGLIAGLLYFGVQWQTRPAAPMQVELWAGAMEASPAPEPEPKPVVKPTPPPEPEPAPEPTPVVKPDIQVEQPKPVKKIEVKKPEPKPEPKKPEPPKKVEPKKPEPTPAKQTKVEPGKNKTLSEIAGKLEKPPLDASVSLAALATRQQAAEAAGKASVMEAYYAKVRNMIRRNMNYPEDAAGNPQAEFSVTLLPDMSVLNVELKKSSGVAAFDDAAKRAIQKTQYPPLPPDVSLSAIRQHTLKYRLRDG